MSVAVSEESPSRPPNEAGLGVFGGLDDGLLLRMHTVMKRVRLLDQRMVTLQRQGRVGFYGACTGQEAAVVGAGLAASPVDWVFPALRENAIMLVRGFPLGPY